MLIAYWKIKFIRKGALVLRPSQLFQAGVIKWLIEWFVDTENVTYKEMEVLNDYEINSTNQFNCFNYYNKKIAKFVCTEYEMALVQSV